MLLEGKKAVVTGGTRGIGFAVVETFLKNGASVALFGSRQETVDKALAKLKAENPDWDVMGLAPDLTDYAAVEAAMAKVTEAFGRIDILVNNAGISAREPLYQYDPTAFKNIMDLNVTAVFNGCRAVAPIMKAQGGGAIINTSSMVSIYGQPSGVGYPTSKFAVNGLTRSLARELGRDNIRVNAVAPGVTRTDMVANLPEDMVSASARRFPSSAWASRRKSPMRSCSSPAIWPATSRAKFSRWTARRRPDDLRALPSSPRQKPEVSGLRASL